MLWGICMLWSMEHIECRQRIGDVPPRPGKRRDEKNSPRSEMPVLALSGVGLLLPLLALALAFGVAIVVLMQQGPALEHGSLEVYVLVLHLYSTARIPCGTCTVSLS